MPGPLKYPFIHPAYMLWVPLYIKNCSRCGDSWTIISGLWCLHSNRSGRQTIGNSRVRGIGMLAEVGCNLNGVVCLSSIHPSIQSLNLLWFVFFILYPKTLPHLKNVNLNVFSNVYFASVTITPDVSNILAQSFRVCLLRVQDLTSL